MWLRVEVRRGHTSLQRIVTRQQHCKASDQHVNVTIHIETRANKDALGIDVPWTQRVDPDAPRAEFAGHAPGHLEDRGFAGVVSDPGVILNAHISIERNGTESMFCYLVCDAAAH